MKCCRHHTQSIKSDLCCPKHLSKVNVTIKEKFSCERFITLDLFFFNSFLYCKDVPPNIYLSMCKFSCDRQTRLVVCINKWESM